MNTKTTVGLTGAFVLGLVLAAAAQDQTPPTGVPLITGYTGSIVTLQPGEQHVSPPINPILLVPIGQRWLVEAEAEFEGSYHHQKGEVWEHEWEKGLEYGQVDFVANKYLTVVAGRFLTPFGIFNERLHPLWVKNLQTPPLIFPMAAGSNNGAMLRGGFRVASNVNINYATYFSAATPTEEVVAQRAAGTRVSAFLPNERLEIGYSFRRRLQDERLNTQGVDWTLQLKPVPLDVRGEYGHNVEQGSGYWAEAAYRLRQIHVARTFFRNSQAVFRFDHFFAPSEEMAAAEMVGESDAQMAEHGTIPDVNTRRVTAGWNYYFMEGFRVAGSYGRDLGSVENPNVWTLGIAYRWVVPLGR